MNLPVSNLAQSKLVLARERAELQPSATWDKKLYVKRGDEVFDELLTETYFKPFSGDGVREGCNSLTKMTSTNPNPRC